MNRFKKCQPQKDLIKEFHIFDQLPGFIGWKDRDSKHLGCNRNLANALKFKKTTDILGLKDKDIAVYTEESCLLHAKNDQLVLTGKIVKGLHKSSSPFDGQVFYFVKKPLLNSENQICGLIYHCNEFNSANPLFNPSGRSTLPPPIKMNLTEYYPIDPVENPFNLSQRELECLFATLRGKNARETGEIMGLTKRTVESYLENIKNKFGCSKKADLIVMAISSGYMHYVPSRFVHSISQFFS